MTHVRIDELTKIFARRGRAALHVLDRVTIEARDNELVCLLGPSGCGKSTVLNVLAQLIEPDDGRILIDGSTAYRNYVFGYVFQQARLLNWMTVRANIAFVLADRGLGRSEIARRIEHYLGLVGLGDFADEYPLNLSGGMQQRVGIARALSLEPHVLLMDEPFSGLDELTARSMRIELLRIWTEAPKTVFFVTHNPLEAVYLADRIYLMTPRPGRVLREIVVDLPRPRDIDDPRLGVIQKGVIKVLLGEEGRA